MRLIRYSLLIALLILSAVSISAQDDDTTGECEINLTSAGSLIVQAQGEASSGQRDAALRTIELLQSVLNDAVERCGGDENASTENDDDETFIALAEQFSTEAFGFAYPEGWVAQSVETFDRGGIVYVGSDSVALRAVSQSDPVLTSGQRSLAVIVAEPTDNVFREPEDATLDDIITSFAEDLADDPNAGSVGEVTSTQVNDFPAASFDFETEGFGGVLLVIDRSDIGVFALILGATATDEVEMIRPLMYAIAESITYAE